MPNNYRMSYFMPPIAPIKDKQGRLMTPPTLIPFCEVSIEQVFQMITCNENLKALTEQVRNSEDIRTAKASLLPYVTLRPSTPAVKRKDFVSPSDPGDSRCGRSPLLSGSRKCDVCSMTILYNLYHLCQPQRTGCKGICSLPLFLHDK